MKALKKLRNKTIAFAIVVMTTLGLTSSPLLAGSSDFTGIYGAIHASINGLAMEGSHRDKDQEISSGSVGALVPLGGLDIGVNLPLGPNFFVAIGTSMVSGEADILHASDASEKDTVSVEASDYAEVYIQPSISLWDNTAVFVKYGQVHAKLTAYGDISSQPDDLSGVSYGVGTQTMSDVGLFIKTEAGAQVFDHFKMTGVGTTSYAGGASDAGSLLVDRVVQGDPLVAYGKVTIGFKF